MLILGGTGFLGRHLVEASLASNVDVTLFTRGRTAPDLFPNLARITGDRDGDLASLESGKWDGVIDTSGYVPRVVRSSAQLLARRVAHYTFISSAAVYDPSAAPPLSEAAPTSSLADESSEDISRDYGALKRACERVLEVELPGRALLIRAGILAGAWDPTDRFTYWIRRLARGGDVLAPAPPEALTQYIDVRDSGALDRSRGATRPHRSVQRGRARHCVRRPARSRGCGRRRQRTRGLGRSGVSEPQACPANAGSSVVAAVRAVAVADRCGPCA